MVSQLTTNGEALRLFFTDDIYLINESERSLNEIKVVANLIEPVSEITGLVEEPIVAFVRTQTEFKFLGSNKRNILILVNDGQNEVSDERGRELLRKIVKSVNLTAGDFALLNYANYENVSFQQLKDHFSSVIIFAFGILPKQLGLNSYPENMVVLEDNVKLIFSAELRNLDEDQNGKKLLWGSLKKLGL